MYEDKPGRANLGLTKRPICDDVAGINTRIALSHYGFFMSILVRRCLSLFMNESEWLMH